MQRTLALVLAAGGIAAACSGGATVTADAGTDFSVSVGEAPAFDGCASTGEISNYAWTIVTAPDSSAESNGKELRTEQGSCDFELESAMIVDDVGEWTIELMVSGGDGDATDQVVVTVTE